MSDFWPIIVIFACAAVYFIAVKTGFILRHLWPIVGLVLVVMWGAEFYYADTINWEQVALGAGTGIALALFAVGGRDDGRDAGRTDQRLHDSPRRGAEGSRLISQIPLDGSAHKTPPRQIGDGRSGRGTGK